MFSTLSPSDRAKYAAAQRAVSEIKSGMKLGLGTGTTAFWMVHLLAQRIREEGLEIVGVPTSRRTLQQAQEEGIPLATLDDLPELDLTLDGADEVDSAFNLIKGGGAALLHEKIVASASKRMIVMADAGKQVRRLGQFPLPVEVIKFGWRSTQNRIEAVLQEQGLLPNCLRRMAGDRPLLTDEGNFILDLNLGRIDDAGALALALNQIPGVVENGLFIGMCGQVIIGHSDGTSILYDAQHSF